MGYAPRVKVLGRYEIVGLLGQGGMGKVHLGFDSVLGRYVAIKQINASVLEHPENATLLAYFQREARVVAQLQHPNIIQVYEYSAPKGENAFIVTEFVDGMTFEELSEDVGPLPPRACLALLHAVAEALEYAHERRIIHRDLKPGNVMLSRHGRVYLMDFGLAKPVESSGLKSMIIGSPAFMAPEQIEGIGTDVRTDVFSFGLLAYALASGELFFSATAAKAFAEIEGCGQREPTERFQSMGPVVRAIEAALGHHGVVSPVREIREWADRWLDLMPQQFTVDPRGMSIQDTIPSAPPDDTPSIPSLELPSGFRGRDPQRPAPVIEFGEGTAVTDGGDELTEMFQDDSEPAAAVESPPGVTGEEPSGLYLVGDDEPTLQEMAPAWPPAVPNDQLEPTVVQPRKTPAPAAPDPIALSAAVAAGRGTTPEPTLSPTAIALRAIVSQQAEPEVARGLLLLVACSGGEVSFAQIRESLGLISPDHGFSEVGGIMASLVQIGALEQRGDDALGLGGRAPVDAVWEIGAASPTLEALGPAVVTAALDAAAEAQHRLDPGAEVAALERAVGVGQRLKQLAAPVWNDVRLRRGEAALRDGDGTTARAMFEAVVPTAPSNADSGLRARVGLARVLILDGDLAGAARWIESGLTFCDDNASMRARLLGLRGALQRRRGLPAEAKHHLSEAIATVDGVQRATLQCELAPILTALGELAPALEAARAAVEVFEEAGDIGSLAAASALIGHLQLTAGRLDEAEEALDRAVSDGKPARASAVVAHARVGLVELHRLEARLDDAVELGERVVADCEAREDAPGLAAAQRVLAAVLSDRGETDRAAPLALAAVEALADDPLAKIEADIVRARVAARGGELGAASRSLHAALSSAEAMGVVAPFGRLAASAMATATGQREAAKSLRAQALTDYESSGRALRLPSDERDLQRWVAEA